jgi:hypothetical protein
MDEFTVLGESNTLVVSGMEPSYQDIFAESNGEEFGLKNEDFSTPERLLAACTGCPPLRDLLESAYLDHRETLQREADSLKGSRQPIKRARRNELKAQLKIFPLSCNKGLGGWIAQLDPQQFELLECEATEWSRLPPENDEPDGQAYALDYFRDLDPEICELLGVSIIEGDHPGSSYFAAELDNSVEEANRIATEHEIPIRFFQ